MGRQLARDQNFLGMPAIKARDVLRAFRFRSDDKASSIANLSKIGLDTRLVMALLGEMEAKGFIGSEPAGHVFEGGFGLTEAGYAFAWADARKRVSKVKAWPILADLLERCKAINLNPDNPRHVNEVWIYGSLISDRDDVGDIDVVVTSEWSPKYSAMPMDARRQVYAKYAQPFLPRYRSFLDQMDSAKNLFERQVYGARRHPLLSPGDLETLKDMHVPCRRLFASSEGGLVADPVLPHHPGSEGRDADRRPPMEMPDLGPAEGPFSFTHARWLDGFVPNSKHGGDLTFLGADQSAGQLGPAYLELSVLQTPEHLSAALPEGRTISGHPGEPINGIEAFALGFGGWAWSQTAGDYLPCKARHLVLVGRSLQESDQGAAYELRLTDLSDDPDIQKEDILTARAALMTIASADIQRILRRRSELGQAVECTVNFVGNGTCYADKLASLLREASELPGWIGPTPGLREPIVLLEQDRALLFGAP